MKIIDAINIGIDLVKSNLDAKILMSYILDISHEELLLNYQKELSDHNYHKFIELINRRINQEPIALIIGKKEFYSLDFFVDNNTLIPRPDSEILVDYVIKYCQDLSTKLTPQIATADEFITIADLGTGSGCLIISILSNIKNTYGTAIDINNKALDMAKKNALKHNIAHKIEFICNDWLENIKEKFDIIISNPPYITDSDYINLMSDVKYYEPKLALTAGDDGLNCYQKIIPNLRKNLKSGGLVAFEIGINQEHDVSNILKEHNFSSIKFLKDLNNVNRAIIASYLE